MKQIATTLLTTLLFILLSAVAGDAQQKIRGVASGEPVVPRVIPSVARLVSTSATDAVAVPGQEIMRPEHPPMSEEEFEMLKNSPAPRWDGKGILTIDRSASAGLPPGMRSSSSVTGGPPALGVNFEGTIQDFSIPCDAMIAVGPTAIISTGNSTIRIAKKDGTILKTVRADIFFGITPPGTTSKFYDPKVAYDLLAGRFLVLYDYMDESVTPSQSWYVLAISQTSDPMGSWYVYQYDMTKDGTTATSNWSDFPGLGFDDNCIYMTGNMYTFPSASGSFRYTKIRVVDKNTLYMGFPTGYQDIIGVPGGGIFGFTIKPAMSLSHSTTGWFLITGSGGGSTVGLYSVTGGPDAPVLDLARLVPVSSYAVPPNAPQQGCPGSPIETNDARTQDPVFRDGYLYAVHTIGVSIDTSSVSAVRYYKINTTTLNADIVETFAAPNTWFYYPAVTVDGSGRTYFSFGRSSSTEYASACFTGRRATDTAIQASVRFKYGSGSYRCGSSQRWGDYMGIAIDPSDTGGTSTSAWASALYTKGSVTWGCWVGQATFLFYEISGTVVSDCDSNNASTGDRRPLAGSTVTIYRDSTVIVDSVMTDSLGAFAFGRLEAGIYDLVVAGPAGSTPLSAAAGTGGLSQTVLGPSRIRIEVGGTGVTAGGNQFVVVTQHAVPTLSTLSPAEFSAGEPGCTLTAEGTNFEPCSVVRVNGADRATSWLSPTRLNAAITAADIASTGTLNITVFTGTPGGGESSSLPFAVVPPAPIFSVVPTPSITYPPTYVGGTVAETLFVTNNGTATLNITSVLTDTGVFAVAPSSASVLRQTTQPFLVSFTPAAVGAYAGHVTFTHDAPGSPAAVMAYGSGKDSLSLRTASSADWATAMNYKNQRKGSLHKPDKVFFEFALPTPSGGTSGTSLNMDFTLNTVGGVYASPADASPVATFTGKSVQITFTPALPQQQITIRGVGDKGKVIKSKYAWSPNKKVDVITLGPYVRNQPGLPKPNLDNVGEELFSSGYGGGLYSKTSPLILGIPQGTKGAGSVKLAKWADALASFVDSKTGTQHINGPKCLNRFDSNDSIKSQQTKLSPLKQNNKLFAELLAFKLNIGASVIGKFPAGFGQLTYDDPADTANPFRGLLLTAIASKVDSIVTCLPVAGLSSQPTLADAYALLLKLNRTFADTGNFKDTIAFAAKTRMRGVYRMGDIAWLRQTPGLAPFTIATPELNYNAPQYPFGLSQNYPNPFNPVTRIQFAIPVRSVVSMTVYDVLGREVTRLIDHQMLDEGDQETQFDGSTLSSGIYFYRLEAVPDEGAAAPVVQVRKMILMK